MSEHPPFATPIAGRLSMLAAAYVIARRDFVAILFSRSFVFFLLGPLFVVVVAGFSGGLGEQMQAASRQPHLGLAMTTGDIDAFAASQRALAAQLGDAVPPLVVVRRLAPGEAFVPEAALARSQRDAIGAVLTGTLAHPMLTGTAEQIEDWRGPVALIAGSAIRGTPQPVPVVALKRTASSAASEHQDQLVTAQAAQTLLFLLTMLLAGMVLSNLVEEKGNKVIEILAAAIPMDAVFLGKLFAMLGVSFVGIGVWGAASGLFMLVAHGSLGIFPEPAVGWPLLIALGIVYFAMAYLLLGSVFLAIGSLAATVREVQTLSMPATMLQLAVFFLASYAMTKPGSPAEIFAAVFPFSSPFTMLARAAQQPGLGQHVLAIGWQMLCVAVMVRLGSQLFRRRVMKSGPASVGSRRGLFGPLRKAKIRRSGLKNS